MGEIRHSFVSLRHRSRSLSKRQLPADNGGFESSYDPYLSLEDFLPWLYLEPAWLGPIFLTRTGGVVYLGLQHNLMLVDEKGLEMGRLALVDYNIDGSIEVSVLRRPSNMENVYLNVAHNGKRVSGVKEGLGGGNYHNQP